MDLQSDGQVTETGGTLEDFEHDRAVDARKPKKGYFLILIGILAVFGGASLSLSMLLSSPSATETSKNLGSIIPTLIICPLPLLAAGVFILVIAGNILKRAEKTPAPSATIPVRSTESTSGFIKMSDSVKEKLILELKYCSVEAVMIESDIKAIERRNPALEMLGVMGGRTNVIDPLADKRMMLRRAKEKDAEVRANAALKLGESRDKAAVAALINALGDEFATVRINAIEALGKIGDNKAIAYLSKLVQDDQDESVQKKALEVLESIKLPKLAESQNAHSLSASNSSEDVYVEQCLTPKFKEEEGQRRWDSDPEINIVLDPLNNGDYKTAYKEAERIVTKFSDCDFIYDYWGTALMRMGDFDQARQVLNRGLDNAKEKYTLCNTLGELELEAGNIKTAVYWWAQAVHCQQSLKGYTSDLWPYLYLHYAADSMGLADIAKAFITRVDQMRAGQIRLDQPTANNLRNLARKGKSYDIEKVLKELGSKYLT